MEKKIVVLGEVSPKNPQREVVFPAVKADERKVVIPTPKEEGPKRQVVIPAVKSTDVIALEKTLGQLREQLRVANMNRVNLQGLLDDAKRTSIESGTARDANRNLLEQAKKELLQANKRIEILTQEIAEIKKIRESDGKALAEARVLLEKEQKLTAAAKESYSQLNLAYATFQKEAESNPIYKQNIVDAALLEKAQDEARRERSNTYSAESKLQKESEKLAAKKSLANWFIGLFSIAVIFVGYLYLVKWGYEDTIAKLESNLSATQSTLAAEKRAHSGTSDSLVLYGNALRDTRQTLSAEQQAAAQALAAAAQEKENLSSSINTLSSERERLASEKRRAERERNNYANAYNRSQSQLNDDSKTFMHTSDRWPGGAWSFGAQGKSEYTITVPAGTTFFVNCSTEFTIKTFSGLTYPKRSGYRKFNSSSDNSTTYTIHFDGDVAGYLTRGGNIIRGTIYYGY